MISISILSIPLIAMQFTDEVNWKPMDFVVGGTLLFIAGIVIQFILHLVKKNELRIILCVLLIVIFILIWTELAVGIFD